MTATMDVILFGATGMVGQGVLRECLLDPDVRRVVSVGRTPLGRSHPKLQDLVQKDLYDLAPIESQLTGLDACFFCLGVTSTGMTEEAYSRVTYDLALAAAEPLLRLNPQMTFVFVSGVGADSSERGKIMWARVKGKTENALLRMPFRAVYVVRPGFIQPLHGIRSKTKLYQFFYSLTPMLLPLLRRVWPKMVTTTEQLGRAMINAAKRGAPEKILDTAAINRLAS